MSGRSAALQNVSAHNAAAVESHSNTRKNVRLVHATDPAARSARLEQVVAELLQLLGEDASREGLLNTPTRVAKSLAFLTGGKDIDARDVVGDALFDEAHEGMVLVRDIEFYSLCEHHMLPFFGRIHIAYLPNSRVVGLSKLPRLVEVFARRLQVQERLTDQVADALMDILEPHGVAVMAEAVHLCMRMRGVESQGSKTVTSAYRGKFQLCDGLQTEFRSTVNGRYGG